MEVHTRMSFTILFYLLFVIYFILFPCQIAHERFLLAKEKCEVMCLIDILIVFCMQDQGKQVSSDGNTSGTIDQRVPPP